jgi:hypothetical protein
VSPRFEAFLARLYTDEEVLRRFLAAPSGEARRAGLTAAEAAALESVDRVGLGLAARSFARKRERKRKA